MMSDKDGAHHLSLVKQDGDAEEASGIVQSVTLKNDAISSETTVSRKS
jgi:hypothetical protein